MEKKRQGDVNSKRSEHQPVTACITKRQKILQDPDFEIHTTGTATL